MATCRKHNLATQTCRVCKGSGRRSQIGGSSPCTSCKQGQVCPKCGKHWS